MEIGESHDSKAPNVKMTKDVPGKKSDLGGGFNDFFIFTPAWGRFPI